MSIDEDITKLSDKNKLKEHYPKLAKLFNRNQPFIKEQIEEMVSFGVFTEREGNLLKGRYRLLRNDVGHSLFQMLLNDNSKEITWKDIVFVYEMY